eukprot:1404380-Ditylum_brightwellii.AAC.1
MAIADRISTAMLISANKDLTESNKLLAEQDKKFIDKYTQLNEMLKVMQNDGNLPNRGSWWPKIHYDPHGFWWSCGF